MHYLDLCNMDIARKRLAAPRLPADVVIDSDAYCEVDDPYALAYLIASREQVNVRAVFAAPFNGFRGACPDTGCFASSPAEGMKMSYEQIRLLFSLMGRSDLHRIVYKGADRFLRSEEEPVRCDAAERLIALSREYTPENPLYVISIAALTDIATAILLEPEITDRIVLIWLGGHAWDWPDTAEYNMVGDMAATRVVFTSGVPLVQLPCMGVVSAFTVSSETLNRQLSNKNKLCDYLLKETNNLCRSLFQSDTWDKALWDVTAVAWLLGGFTQDRMAHTPLPMYDNKYRFFEDTPYMKYVYTIHSDALLQDLFKKLTMETF